MPFSIIKNRFLRKVEMDGPTGFVVFFVLLVAASIALCLRHAVVMGLLLTPVVIAMVALQFLTDEYTERKQERERAERQKQWEANAPQRAYARAIVQAIRECPPDADDAYRQKAIQEAAERFRSTCDTPLPEFLGAQVDGHFVQATQH